MNNTNKLLISITLLLLSGFFILSDKKLLAGHEFAMQLKGNILLQVEENGEAYYINPGDYKKYYLGRPTDAFDIMRSLSMGITNENLNKIPVALANFEGTDSDGDGLSDAIEKSFGTDINLTDTDNDGFSDKEEILSNYNPLDDSKLNIDQVLIERLAGQILLQTEMNGEAWYLNPRDNKRYFLSRPKDAFEVMRKAGLGASNKDLAKIETYKTPEESKFANILPNFTKPTFTSTKTMYQDDSNSFSLEYPNGWKIKKFGDDKIVQFTDTSKDFVLENSAFVTVYTIDTDQTMAIDDFRVATIEKSETLSDSKKTVGEFEAYENSYKHLMANEIKTTIKLSDTKYLQVSLSTTDKKFDYYKNIYEEILESIKKL